MSFRSSKPHHIKENFSRLLTVSGKSIVSETRPLTGDTDKFQVVSPDGIPINNKWYNSIEDAIIAAKEFVARFKSQGFYSSTRGRIALSHLIYNLKIVNDKNDIIVHSIGQEIDEPYNISSNNDEFNRVANTLISSFDNDEFAAVDYVDYDNDKILIDDLLDDMYIDKKTRDEFVRKYPKYVITKRQFGESRINELGRDDGDGDPVFDPQY